MMRLSISKGSPMSKMTLIWNREKYEMEMIPYIMFRWKRLGFKRMRLLRAIKRTALGLRGWGATLLVFIPIAVAVMMLAVIFGFVDCYGAIIELISIVLGSFLLLSIKESRDREDKRHSILLYQREYCNQLRSNLTVVFNSLMTDCGLHPVGWGIFDGAEPASFYVCFSKELGDTSSRSPTACRKHLQEILKLVEDYRAEVLRTQFVDYEFPSDVSWTVPETEKLIHALLDEDPEIIVSSVRDKLPDLATNLHYIIASIRRPWRYTRERDLKEKLGRFVREKGSLVSD